MPRNCRVALNAGVATVTMDRDDRRNAFDADMLADLKAAFTDIAERRDARVVVVTGVGNTFSAGADLTPVKGITDPAERRRIFAHHGARIADLLIETLHSVLSPDITTIAAINGHAVGGGWGLAMCCDFQIAAEPARFWFPEIELGRAVTPLTCRLVTAQAGPVLAREILMTARRYTAADLKARGLVNDVVPASALPAAAAELAARLKDFDPTALSILKARIHAASMAPSETDQP
jgi:methylglutaconyl-CoA hydratase